MTREQPLEDSQCKTKHSADILFSHFSARCFCTPIDLYLMLLASSSSLLTWDQPITHLFFHLLMEQHPLSHLDTVISSVEHDDSWPLLLECVITLFGVFFISSSSIGGWSLLDP